VGGARLIESVWGLLVVGAFLASTAMALMWAIQVRIRDASHVDVAWAVLIACCAILYALIADGDTGHRVLAAALASLWGFRLGAYLFLDRVLGKEEDGRYQELRRRWAPHANRRFFWFFQFQALFVVFFSLPFAFIAQNEASGLGALEWTGIAVWAVGNTGTILSDVQLARWRRNPENNGKTAKVGLWSWSRHPNYFFESVTWCGVALVASAAPWGWLAWLVPAGLLYLLFKVTGIPATEAQALRSRADYAEYQRTTSVFVPLPPRRG
jgi:steroid 5-alpha reductase family enzyme